jgi:glycosyltransferase involved in cell wall biosynthesis
MKIACFLESYLPHLGGSEIRAHQLLSRLPDKWEIHVFTPRFDGSPKEEALKSNLTVYRLGNYSSQRYFLDSRRPLLDSLKFGLQIVNEARKTDFYDVALFSEWNLLHFWVARTQIRAPKVVDWCEVLASSLRGVKGAVETYLERYVARNADHHIAINSKICENLFNLHGVCRDKIWVVRNGVDRNFLSEKPPVKDAETILYVGRLTPHKQCDKLIKAIQRSVHSKTATLRIVGSGSRDYVAYLKSISSPNVEFLGEIPSGQLLQEYRRASVLVLPSNREGSSLVALEAMANHTPVLTVDAPLNYSRFDMVFHGFNGLVVQDSVAGLTQGIDVLLGDCETYSRLSKNAYITAKSRVWGESASRLAEVLRDAADKRIGETQH